MHCRRVSHFGKRPDFTCPHGDSREAISFDAFNNSLPLFYSKFTTPAAVLLLVWCKHLCSLRQQSLEVQSCLLAHLPVLWHEYCNHCTLSRAAVEFSAASVHILLLYRRLCVCLLQQADWSGDVPGLDDDPRDDAVLHQYDAGDSTVPSHGPVGAQGQCRICWLDSRFARVFFNKGWLQNSQMQDVKAKAEKKLATFRKQLCLVKTRRNAVFLGRARL